ncbi:MAG: hypothetical protein MPW14_06065 [Candidatus Manganitrophus sp.]|nr:MAG: hypothetical protein MPW14_06065 [Candidatus Manganitrophus sp.]
MDLHRIFFDNWMGVVRTLIIGVLAYAALVLLLRISGKRTLSKMNAFDLVVTVALGSTLATILLSKNVALVEGILAFALLIGLQYLVAWASVHSPLVRRIVKSEPALLFYRGEFLRETLRRERVTEGGGARGDPGGRNRKSFGGRSGRAGDRRLFQRRPKTGARRSIEPLECGLTPWIRQ